MKANRFFSIIMILAAMTGLFMTGCKKDNTEKKEPSSSNIQQLTKDVNRVESSTDEAMNDVDALLTQGNLKSTAWLPCHATVDSMNILNDTIVYYITYNGLNCSETVFRTGQVEIRKAVGTHWYNPGATVIVKFIDLHLVRQSDNKSLTLNGTKTHTNVSGGLIPWLGYGITSVMHRTSGFMIATFDDNSTKVWYIARQHTYTGMLGTLVVSVDGFGTSGNYTNLAIWGTNRQGEEFYNSVIDPVEFRQVCNFDPCAGSHKIEIPSADKGATVTYGYDNNNQLVTGNNCPTKYKVDWYIGNVTGTIYLPLH